MLRLPFALIAARRPHLRRLARALSARVTSRLATHRLPFTARPGQGFVEYAVMCAAVVVAVIGVITIFGQAIATQFTDITTFLNTNRIAGG